MKSDLKNPHTKFIKFGPYIRMLFSSHVYTFNVFHIFSLPQKFFCLLTWIVFSSLSVDKTELDLQISFTSSCLHAALARMQPLALTA